MKIIGIYYLYHFLFFLVSLVLIREIRKYERACKSRFAVVIPAHNEEKVIGDSLRSIMNCNYPRSLFDVFVIADNCSDRTAELAKEAGAWVLGRYNKTLRGKQHALKWAFQRINLKDYDAVVILDADNHVDRNYLRVLDSEMAKGHKVIQGYVETKNPCDSWVTANYAYMFWYICRLQMARSKIGFSAWLAGTGLCISTDVLRRVGWNVRTMTDDVEYTCQLILAGERVVFAQDAIVYDQKPVKLADSMRQRLRWIRGQTQISLKYIPRLLVAVIRFWWQGNFGQAARALDAVMWVPMHLVICASVILSLYQGWWQYLLSVFLTVPVFNMLPMLAEQVKKCKAWAYLVTAGVFLNLAADYCLWGDLLWKQGVVENAALNVAHIIKKKSEMAVFTKAKELISFSYSVTENWPKKYRYDFTARVRNTAFDIYEKITEANEIYIEKLAEKDVVYENRFLLLLRDMTRASRIIKRRDLQNEASTGLKILEYLFSEAYSRHLINAKKWEHASEIISEVTRLLYAWICSDRKRFNFRDRAETPRTEYSNNVWNVNTNGNLNNNNANNTSGSVRPALVDSVRSVN